MFGKAVKAPSQVQMGLVTLSLLALVVGGVTGVGAAFLRMLIAVVHNGLFLGQLSWIYEANEPTSPSHWGPFVILAPIIGGLVVVYLVRRFAPEAKGHGVPEVMYAIFYKQGHIRPMVVIIKSLASALSIGSGASVGREGPIIQIGSGIGSTLGQIFHLAKWQTITLVAAGAGAGIAATFNTPLGAVMFSIELMMPEVSPRTFLPVVLATGAATFVGRFFFGIEPAFAVATGVLPDQLFPSAAQFLPIYVLFGMLCGVASAYFVKLLHWMEDIFDNSGLNPYVANAIGMAILGILMYTLFLIYGRYFTDGVGYATIQDILTGDITLAYLMAILFFAKLFATCLSLSAGASGGVFSPSLFLGATLGGCFGAILSAIWPHLGFSPVQFAVIGMAAVVGGSTGAAMTAILMIFEMTGDYTSIVPEIIAVASAIGMRRMFVEDNIYTMKLARRGLHIPKERHSLMFSIRKASDVMVPVSGVLPVGHLAEDVGRTTENWGVRMVGDYYAAVENDRGHLVGLIAADKDGKPIKGATLVDNFTIVRKDEFLNVVMGRMARHNAVAAAVIDSHGIPRPSKIVGVIHRGTVGNSIINEFNE